MKELFIYSNMQEYLNTKKNIRFFSHSARIFCYIHYLLLIKFLIFFFFSNCSERLLEKYNAFELRIVF